ncbi:N-acetylmuramoyl-L-alanine amidase family protein [Prosthecobacter fusiformis]|uniref:N-acetylmuramoyl-L-alanine amidase family protein n=1 Tax=Prosthecobacter fusiformis TaxID=48464 RepID=UPI001414D0CE|nr:N-acetylmuramoyl-L-alanine amidase [Prosthecobacter fusiformis]
MLFWLLLGGIPVVAQALTFSTVVLDAGHGGHDGGAAWYGLVEKRLCLDVAQRVERLLKAKGLRVVMTRRSDTFIALDQRARIANRYSRSVFVSIHFNANRKTSIHGMEGYYRSSRGRILASSILRSMDRKVTGTYRGLFNRDFKVLRSTAMPATVIECGYLSNRTESKRCASPAHRQAIAEAIASGILAARG